MKFIIVFFLLISFVNLHAQSESDNQQVEGTIVKFFEGLSSLKDEDIRSQVTDDFILLEDGEWWTVDTLITAISPMKKRNFKRINSFKFVKTEQVGSVAWTSYENTAEVTVDGKQREIKWLESAVLVRLDEKWKIKMLHSTVIRK